MYPCNRIIGQRGGYAHDASTGFLCQHLLDRELGYVNGAFEINGNEPFTRPQKTLQETLQLCTEQSGKKGCKILARSRFSASYGTEVNEIPWLFQLFATENPGDR